MLGQFIYVLIFIYNYQAMPGDGPPFEMNYTICLFIYSSYVYFYLFFSQSFCKC